MPADAQASRWHMLWATPVAILIALLWAAGIALAFVALPVMWGFSHGEALFGKMADKGAEVSRRYKK